MTTPIAFPISAGTGEPMFFDLELEFADYRSRIALVSIEARSAVTEMLLPIAPAEDAVIDITAIESETLDLTAASAELTSAIEVLEAFDRTIASIEEASATVFDLEPAAA